MGETNKVSMSRWKRSVSKWTFLKKKSSLRHFHSNYTWLSLHGLLLPLWNLNSYLLKCPSSSKLTTSYFFWSPEWVCVENTVSRILLIFRCAWERNQKDQKTVSTAVIDGAKGSLRSLKAHAGVTEHINMVSGVIMVPLTSICVANNSNIQYKESPKL